MEKKVRVEIGIIGSMASFIVGIILYTLGGTELSMALAVSVAGGLGFFLGWWAASSRFHVTGAQEKKRK